MSVKHDILKEECRLRVSENTVSRRFYLKGRKLIGE
jgi:hypothetical protein